MAANPPGQAFPNNARVAILAELERERRRLIQSQSMNTPGASISLSRPSVKDFRDNAEQQHIAAQQKAALQVRPSSTRGRSLLLFFLSLHTADLVDVEFTYLSILSARTCTFIRLLYYSRLIFREPNPPCYSTPGAWFITFDLPDLSCRTQ
uniref:SOSS complex subunit C n=1 Tax=Oryzias sinensis TaxID=183150 RepID=A0A8C7ZD54_9TELE